MMPVESLAAIIIGFAGSSLIALSTLKARQRSQETDRKQKRLTITLGLLSAWLLLAGVILVFIEAPLALLTIPALFGGYVLVTIALDALTNRGAGSQAASAPTVPYGQ
jgi:L-asparagine transporter-like permease